MVSSLKPSGRKRCTSALVAAWSEKLSWRLKPVVAGVPGVVSQANWDRWLTIACTSAMVSSLCFLDHQAVDPALMAIGNAIGGLSEPPGQRANAADDGAN